MRVQVVSLPGRQPHLQSLCPKTTPIILTGLLRSEGISAGCTDAGVLDTLDEYASAHTKYTADKQLQGGRFRLRGIGLFAGTTQDAAFYSSDAWVAGAAQAILKTVPSVLAWYVETRSDYIAVKMVSGYVRRHAPEVHQTVLGPYMTRFGACILQGCQFLDTGITEAPVAALVSLAKHVKQQRMWSGIPGLVYRDGAALTTNPVPPCREQQCIATAYLPEKASVISAHRQFAVYPVSFHNPPLVSDGSLHDPALDTTQVPADVRVMRIMVALNVQYGASAFHIDATDVSAAALKRFAEGLLAQDVMSVYSLGGLTAPFDGKLADRLFASGCRAVGFHVPSGSQRLLEDFHGCNMSISAIRATLRACRSAGLFTVARMCYPCPRDDYHSRAETELFIEACRPDGVQVEAPVLHPDTYWFTRAPEYGFLLDYRAYQHWVSGNNTQPYRMRGWKNGRATEARRAVEAAAQQLGVITGITEQHGLLARIARSAMDEPVFLACLHDAMDTGDAEQVAQLMNQVNGTLDMLHTPAATGRAAEAL